jgi:hypothetical protein
VTEVADLLHLVHLPGRWNGSFVLAADEAAAHFLYVHLPVTALPITGDCSQPLLSNILVLVPGTGRCGIVWVLVPVDEEWTAQARFCACYYTHCLPFPTVILVVGFPAFAMPRLLFRVTRLTCTLFLHALVRCVSGHCGDSFD